MNAMNMTYQSLDNNEIFKLIETTRDGVKYATFDQFSEKFPLNYSDWSRILHVSERTMQRYKKEKKKFDSLHSEKLLMIMLLFQKGIEVFGNSSKFISWINSKNIALGGIKPKNLLDNSFGINMIKDELIKIEHGILA
jgi:putative toxin-antitoxin system antitoxin component (TIGR02293 family)